MQKMTIIFLSMMFPLHAALIEPSKRVNLGKTVFSTFLLSPCMTEEQADMCNDAIFNPGKNPVLVLVDNRSEKEDIEAFIKKEKLNCIYFKSQPLNSKNELENRAQSKVYSNGTAIYRETTLDLKKIDEVSDSKRNKLALKYAKTMHALAIDTTHRYLNKIICGDVRSDFTHADSSLIKKSLQNLLVIIDVTDGSSSDMAMCELIYDAFINKIKQRKITSSSEIEAEKMSSIPLLLSLSEDESSQESYDEDYPKIEEISEEDEDKVGAVGDKNSSTSSEDDSGQLNGEDLSSEKKRFSSSEKKKEEKKAFSFTKYKIIGLSFALATIVGLLYYYDAIISDLKHIPKGLSDFLFYPFIADSTHHEFSLKI